MKKNLTILLASIILTSCKDKEPNQYSLATNDVQKIEELTCYLLKK